MYGNVYTGNLLAFRAMRKHLPELDNLQADPGYYRNYYPDNLSF
ncbi:MAG: hypothetical protein ACOX2B_03835 [Syntrophothermaceae bacterium]|jgi:hypothetical protein